MDESYSGWRSGRNVTCSGLLLGGWCHLGSRARPHQPDSYPARYQEAPAGTSLHLCTDSSGNRSFVRGKAMSICIADGRGSASAWRPARLKVAVVHHLSAGTHTHETATGRFVATYSTSRCAPASRYLRLHPDIYASRRAVSLCTEEVRIDDDSSGHAAGTRKCAGHILPRLPRARSVRLVDAFRGRRTALHRSRLSAVGPRKASAAAYSCRAAA